MSFKIVITDNDNGKVLVNEENAVAILGSFVNEEKTVQMGFCKCNSVELACAVREADEVIRKIKSKKPELELLEKLAALKELFEKNSEDKE